MLTVHRGQEVKSMLKLKDANEISQRHRLSHSLTHSLFLVTNVKIDGTQGAHKTVFKTKVNKQHKCCI